MELISHGLLLAPMSGRSTVKPLSLTEENRRGVNYLIKYCLLNINKCKHLLFSRRELVVPGCLVLAKQAPPSSYHCAFPSGPLPCNKGKGEGMQATQQGFADGPASSCLTCGALLPSLLLLGTPKSVLSAPMPGHTLSGSLFPPQSH